MKVLKRHGLPGVERVVTRVNVPGHPLVRQREEGVSQRWRRAWSSSPRKGRRVLEVSVMDTGDLLTTSVEYREVPQARLSKQQREVASLHEAFYAKYGDIAAIAYANDQPPQLRPLDRLLLLIAELEADLNNGGFAQYLENKGRRRARSAMTALRMVGARRTERMLQSALQRHTPSARFERLDEQFYSSPEDLAALVMRHRAAAGERGEMEGAAHQGIAGDEVRAPDRRRRGRHS